MMTNPRTHLSLLVGALALAGCSDAGGTTTDAQDSASTSSSTGEPGSTGTPVTTDEPTTTTGTPTTSTSTTGPATTDDTATSDSTIHPSSTGDGTTEPAASCDDGTLNQDETDVDCGGAACSPCADGQQCGQDSDCEVASCVGGVCVAPSCEDLVKNADETDVDCGGPTCPACGDGLACADATDCTSGVCTDGMCAPASCGDGVLNQDETDVDCGGATCTGCLGDELCLENSDCLSGTCALGMCTAPLCLVDSDCDMLDGECTQGVCQMPGFTCVAEPVNDGQACEDGTVCFEDSVCSDGTCGGGTPLDCSDVADACHSASCDAVNGCFATEAADGTDCEDGSTCTNTEVCQAGVCGGSLDDIFTEDFSDNSAGWTLGTQWAIGPAAASVGCNSGQDPASDVTPTDDNGVAGVVIGGCIPNTTVHDYYCLESPTIDLSAAPAEVYLSFQRWLNSDYTPYMKNTLSVFNGTNWVVLWETLGSPGNYDNAWKFVSYNVTAHKNADFRARWCFNVGSTGVFLVSSWSIDDVSVGPNACVQ
ncbi:hypothetical protein [Nannocystis punicea]|uniref:MAM domain-containing protein n=1 Tax=Nannocystis punicea TaxID=2995304 RepID=A0ABY7GU58_9BACT|nr:hypothetical protein [Nannocystis poenicansa]WAS90494.1 hypothetical protein O0S08_30265 [Nannocystis poenicansa]